MLFSPPQGYEPTSREISPLHLPGIQLQRDSPAHRQRGESLRCRGQCPPVKEVGVTPDPSEDRPRLDVELRIRELLHLEISLEAGPDAGVCGKSCPAFSEFAP